MIADHLIMTVVIMIVAAPGIVYDIVNTFGKGAPPKLMLGNLYLNVFAFSLYFNKDIYLGRSPGKRILRLQLVNAKSNQPAGPLRCVVRNITIILWPIEVVAALVNNQRRIGDYIAGTKLTTYTPDQMQEKPDWGLIAITLLVGMLFTYLVMFYPFEYFLPTSIK